MAAWPRPAAVLGAIAAEQPYMKAGCETCGSHMKMQGGGLPLGDASGVECRSVISSVGSGFPCPALDELFSACSSGCCVVPPAGP